MSIYTFIRNWAEKKERQKADFDCLCTHCNRWQSNHGGMIGYKDAYPSDKYFAFQCANCKRWQIQVDKGRTDVPASDQSAARALEVDIERWNRNDKSFPLIKNDLRIAVYKPLGLAECVLVTHKRTGLFGVGRGYSTYEANRDLAMDDLRERLNDHYPPVEK